MKTRLAFILVLLVVALVGCGDSKSAADNTEAEQLKERIASLEKKLKAKQEPDSEADAIPVVSYDIYGNEILQGEAEEKRRAAFEEREKAAEAREEEADVERQARIDGGPKDTSTPEKLLAAYFDARSIDERLLYVADRESSEAKFRESFKDKDWDNPTTWSLISADELSSNETKVVYSLHFPVIWEVILKKEEGTFRFDNSTEKINLGVKIAGLREFPRVDADRFFSNPRAYSDKLVRLDAVKLMSSVRVTHENPNGTKFGNITCQSGNQSRFAFLDATRLPKLEVGDVASFIATVKVFPGRTMISLIEMIEGSHEPAPAQISLKRLEVFGKDYVGKKVRFSNVNFYDIAQSRISSFPMIQIKTDGLITTYLKNESEKWVNFVFDERGGETCWYTLASKERWAEFLLGLKRNDKINIEGVVVDLPSSSDYGIIVTDIEKLD